MSETIKLNICPKCGGPIPAEAPQGLCPKCVLGGAANPTEAGIAATATGEIPTIERIAAAFPQLEILELIGRGGMGFVFKARQPHLDRYVALKLLPDKLAKDPHFAERFNREGRFLAKLNHPNIVSVFDFGQAGGFYFLLMEYVDGVNLRQAMRAGRFSPTEALAIVPKICEALQYAHEQGVLHRDIKPENILLDAKGRVKIADFGIAKLVGEDAQPFTLTGTGAALGTPHYMAPEQLEKPSEVDHRADIYSLGVVFYEMLTGELPIGRFKPPSERTPLDRRVDEIVMRALERERELRQKNADEIKTQVERVTSEPHASQKVQSTARTPAWSLKAIFGAVLVAISFLPTVALLMFVTYFAVASRGGLGGWEMLLIIATLFLPAVAGTTLGWMGLSDIRVHAGQRRGLPLAIFAALAWPLLILIGVTLVIPWLLIQVPANSSQAPSLFARLVALIIPAGTLTFGIWSIYATARWASGRHTGERRGVLKWVFVALLTAGVGMIVLRSVSSRSAPAIPVRDGVATVVATSAVPTLYLTVTSVELRDEGATGRWLALDFSEQEQGDCELVVRTDGAGRNHTTRKSGFLKNIPGVGEVRHQRVEWLLPEDLDETARTNLRATVAKARLHQTLSMQPGTETPLFDIPLPNGGKLAASFGAKLKDSPTVNASPETIAKYKAVIARLESARAREFELAKQYSDENPLLKRIRERIADAEQQKKAMEAETDDLHKIQIRLARDTLAETRKRFENGLIGDQEVAKAERDLAITEARGDAVAIAKANLKFAESELIAARKRHETGVISGTELREAESRHASAAVELHRARLRLPPRQWLKPEDQRAYDQQDAHVASLREKAQQLSQQYTPENPLVQRALQELREAETKLRALEKRSQ